MLVVAFILSFNQTEKFFLSIFNLFFSNKMLKLIKKNIDENPLSIESTKESMSKEYIYKLKSSAYIDSLNSLWLTNTEYNRY